MTSHRQPSDHDYGAGEEQRPTIRRKPSTRLPVLARTSKQQSRDRFISPPLDGKSSISTFRRVTKTNALPSQIAATTNRLQLRDATTLSSVAHAGTPSDTPSAVNESMGALPLKRQSFRPPASSIKTPSLVSGSTASTCDSAGSVLRRKASTIDQYSLRAKTDPDSMQEHRNLIETAYNSRGDDDPFPGPIFGMALPPVSGFRGSKALDPTAIANDRPAMVRDTTKTRLPTVDLADAASSRHSDSPFSHLSSPTSASSYSSFIASSVGSTRKRESEDLSASEGISPSRRETVSEGKTKVLKKYNGARQSSEITGKPQVDREKAPAKQTRHQSSSLLRVKQLNAHEKHHTTSDSTIAVKTKPHEPRTSSIPPELAHLNVNPPSKQFSGGRAPPRRPSRDGTDNLTGLIDDLPIVQSNLAPAYASYRKRTPSEETPEPLIGSPFEGSRRRLGLSSRSSSRQDERPPSRNACPSTPSTPDSTVSRRDSPMTGFLTRWPKEGSTKPDKTERRKRGPAAGTGHEGYGKFGFRGRGTNVFGGSRQARSPSNESSTSRRGSPFLSRKKSGTSDVDEEMRDFLEQRKEPVILRGNGSRPDPSKQEQLSHADEDTYRLLTKDASVSHDPGPLLQTTLNNEDKRLNIPKGPSLSELGGYGNEGHWLTAAKSPKHKSLLQRVKSRMSSPNSIAEPPRSGMPQIPPQPSVIVRHETSANLASIVNGRHPPVPYEQRHEGLMPPPARSRMQSSPSESSFLLKAQTATSANMPRLIDIPKMSPLSPKPFETPATRLKSIGRIPQVVRTDKQGSLKSFSRPFAKSRIQPFSEVGEHGMLDETPQANLPIQFVNPFSGGDHEFISFSPRKNSELSYTSSSGLESSHVQRTSISCEDDIWNEYDELLDDVMLSRTHAPTNSSLGTQLQSAADTVEPEFKNAQKNSTIPTNTSHSRTPREKSIDETSRPSTTFSISDYLVDSQGTNGDTVIAQRDAAANKRESLDHQMDVPETSTSTMDQTSSSQEIYTDDPAPSAELRFAALMTSKWLSFGRLLFSPAHEEAKIGDDARVLIIDGLGKEWSYHCALTYPKCQFYNLSSERYSPTWESLPNHHHIPHASISTPFPFPRSFFSAVVFRFATAESDDAYQACFHEIKRTLRPSGYLETSALDLDLMNMGSKARKAVRDLKIRMQGADSQISLWNHGDAFLTHLGRRGFENVHRCVVGLPVAGRIRRSCDSSSSDSAAEMPKTDTRPPEREPNLEYLSFTEWMKGTSSKEGDERDESNDEDITMTVAKVGRWWYSTCYPDPGTGSAQAAQTRLWDTPGLLRECERHRTSFRLLFCYAQKPMRVKRRTASV